jgi:hypothetical protein
MIYEHDKISFGYDYDNEKNILIGRNDIKDAGFFSTFTLMICAIMTVYEKFHRLPDDIDGTSLLKQLDKNGGYDMYHHFFNMNKTINIPFDSFPFKPDPNEHHTIYTEEKIKYFKPFFDRYFNLNDNVISKIHFLKEKYKIESEKTISIIYRDTDKWIDFGGFNYVSAGPYMRIGREILTNNPDYRVLIQTENDGVKHHMGNGIRATFIDETLTSETSISPIFNHYKGNKMEWSEYYVAALWIHSKSNYLITYTGNSAFFLYLNRGTTKNMIQEITFTKNYNDFFIKNA